MPRVVNGERHPHASARSRRGWRSALSAQPTIGLTGPATSTMGVARQPDGGEHLVYAGTRTDQGAGTQEDDHHMVVGSDRRGCRLRRLFGVRAQYAPPGTRGKRLNPHGRVDGASAWTQPDLDDLGNKVIAPHVIQAPGRKIGDPNTYLLDPNTGAVIADLPDRYDCISDQRDTIVCESFNAVTAPEVVVPGFGLVREDHILYAYPAAS